MPSAEARTTRSSLAPAAVAKDRRVSFMRTRRSSRLPDLLLYRSSTSRSLRCRKRKSWERSACWVTMPTGDGSMTVRPPRDTDRLSLPVVSSRDTRARGSCAAAARSGPDTAQTCTREPASWSARAGTVMKSVAANPAQSAATAVLIGTAMRTLPGVGC
ncbi:hypothetical protein StrepF001_41025 [Streptomyces sp. F001]|nr:hypothetical protein StrepF001_41025 [Streptomyces sp. F001]